MPTPEQIQANREEFFKQNPKLVNPPYNTGQKLRKLLEQFGDNIKIEILEFLDYESLEDNRSTGGYVDINTTHAWFNNKTGEWEEYLDY